MYHFITYNRGRDSGQRKSRTCKDSVDLGNLTHTHRHIPTHHTVFKVSFKNIKNSYITRGESLPLSDRPFVKTETQGSDLVNHP